MNRIIGIDPGKRGGMAEINEEGEVINVFSFHKLGWFNLEENFSQAIGTHMSACPIFLEKVHAFKKQGVTSTFTFGVGYGFIIGCITAYGKYKDLNNPSPKTWQEYFGLVTKRKKGLSSHEKYLEKKNHKLKLLKKAIKYYPQATLDTADAVLIARYGWELQKSV